MSSDPWTQLTVATGCQGQLVIKGCWVVSMDTRCYGRQSDWRFMKLTCPWTWDVMVDWWYMEMRRLHGHLVSWPTSDPRKYVSMDTTRGVMANWQSMEIGYLHGHGVSSIAGYPWNWDGVMDDWRSTEMGYLHGHGVSWPIGIPWKWGISMDTGMSGNPWGFPWTRGVMIHGLWTSSQMVTLSSRRTFRRYIHSDYCLWYSTITGVTGQSYLYPIWSWYSLK